VLQEAEALLKDKKEYTKMQKADNKIELELEGLLNDAAALTELDARLQALIVRRRGKKRDHANDTG
jgi:hypothetical protein